MIKNITVGSQTLTFEANMGTAQLFEIYTGQNIFTLFAGLKMTKKTTPEGKTIYKLAESIDERLVALQLKDVYLKLAFVMAMQASTQGEDAVTKIRNIKARLNDEEYLAWLCGFEQANLPENFYTQIAELWTANQETKSDAKN